MRPTRSILWLLIPIAFAFRLIYAVSRELVPDEAFYWVLSRHLSAGYLDHPPMVAYVIKLGTMLLGSNELGVRFGAAAMAFGALLVLLSLSRRMVGERATVWLAIIWLVSPLFAGLATIMTPDTPAIFFSMCAMGCAVKATLRTEDSGLRTERKNAADFSTQSSVLSPQSSFWHWLGFGYFTGLAMASKYTAVLPAGAVVLAMLTSREGLREFRKPGIWLAGIVALLVFSPVIYWNATHQWASFKFQLHHGLDEVDAGVVEISGGEWLQSHFGSLGKYLVGQIGFFTPIFFIFGVVVVAIRWRQYRELSPVHRILVWSATVPLCFFGFTAFMSAKPGEGNWPAFGYFPMSLLMLEHIARQWKSIDLKFLKIGSGVALAITIALHSPDLLFAGLEKAGMPEVFPRKLNQFYGWRHLAQEVNSSRGDNLIVCGTHQDAAELSFYLPGQPVTWVFPISDSAGHPVSRPTAFEYFPERPDLAKVPRVLFFMGRTEDFCRQYGFARTESLFNLRTLLHGHWRERRFDLCLHR